MKEKGSTLFLAMVVISVILASGMGVGLLLTRQVREIGTKENEATAFYVADTVAEGIEKGEFALTDNFAEIDWSSMGLQKDIAYIAEEKMGGYKVTIRIEDDYHSFLKIKEENGENFEDEEIEGTVVIYYQTEPWENWNPPYVSYRLQPSGDIPFPSDNPLILGMSEKYKGWHFARVDFENQNTIEGYFQDGGDGRDYVGDNYQLYCIESVQSIVNIRQNSGIVDNGRPISIYYNTKGEWITPYIAYRLTDSQEVIRSSLEAIQMYDASEYGSHWYVIHISPQSESGIDVYFTDGGDGRDSLYQIPRESVVNIEKDSGIINNGLPN